MQVISSSEQTLDLESQTRPKTCYVIGVAGASGAGKSRLSQLLYEKLLAEHGCGDVAILKEDAYYRDRSDLSYEQRCKINYDHPNALEHDLLCEHLGMLRNGATVQVPQYDYAQHNRMAKSVALAPARIVILEGILLLSDPILRRQLDLKVFVDVPLDICLLRRLRRDIQERGRTLESVLQQYDETVRPMFFQYIDPSKEHADLIIPSVAENPNALNVLGSFLTSILSS